MFCTKVVRAEDDDDDNILGELIIDMLTGAAVAACQSNASCNAILAITTFIFTIIALVGWCMTGCNCDCEAPTRRDMRRAGGMGLGYSIGRQCF